MKRLLFFLILALSAHGQILSGILGAGSAVAPASCHTVATDNFATFDTTTNWQVQAGGFAVASSSVYANSVGTTSMAGWKANSLNADQCAIATVSNLGSATPCIGIGVRISATAATETGYVLNICPGGSPAANLYYANAGSYADLLATHAIPTVGQVVQVDIQGTTLNVRYDGVVVIGPINVTTHGNLASGRAGLMGFSADPPNNTVTTFKPGNFN